MKKEIDDDTVKDTKNLFRLEKVKKKTIRNRIVRDIRNLFDHEEEENYYMLIEFFTYQICWDYLWWLLSMV